MDNELNKNLSEEDSAYLNSIAEANRMVSEMHLADARLMFTELSVNHPGRAEAWLGLAELDFMDGDYDGCAKNFAKAHRASPSTGTAAIIKLAMNDPAKLFILAKAIYRQSLYEESFKLTDRLVEMELDEKFRQEVIMLRDELRSSIEKQHQESVDPTMAKSEHNYRILFKSLGIFFIVLLVGLGLMFVLAGKLGLISFNTCLLYTSPSPRDS